MLPSIFMPPTVVRAASGDPSAAQRLWDTLEPFHDREAVGRIAEPEDEPMPVPSTAVYTRSDGVVRWWQCLDDEGPIRENIEVYGSHSGLGFNPAAIFAITDRLAQKPGEWKKFKAPPGTSQFFPKPATWRPTVAA